MLTSNRSFLRQWKLILIVGIIVGAASVAASFLFKFEHRADAQVLIISKTRTGVDPYTTVKSAERVGENLAAVMETTDFYDKVKAQTGFTIDWSRFTDLDERKRRRLWAREIAASVTYGTGILNVSVFSPNPSDALQLAGAASRALVEHGWEYVGGDVTIKQVNSPVVTLWPARPNLILNGIVGFAAGALLAGLFAVARK